jgi:hypothetical protein
LSDLVAATMPKFPNGTPFHDTFIDGKYTIFIGTAAVRFYQQELMGQQITGMQPPILLFLGGDASINPDRVDALDSTNFTATFKTVYGETGCSNVITITSQNWSYVNLDIDYDQVPTYVTGVVYYRSFNGVFFSVLEISKPGG